MNKQKSIWTAALVAALAMTASIEARGGGAGCSAESAALTCEVASTATFQQALDQAGAAGRPLLIKVGAEWCTVCKSFDQATAGPTALTGAIAQNALLYRVDGEKGDGKALAERYRVHGYPTFLLVNAEGRTIDRWMGYKDDASFTTTLTEATADPITVEERAARFTREPSGALAKKLGDLRMSEGLYAEACAFYQRGAELDPDGPTNYASLVFYATSMGTKGGTFSAATASERADLVLASSKTTPQDLFKVAYSMGKVAHGFNDQALFTPYLRAAVERTADSTDPEIAAMRSKLMPDYALRVTKDVDAAVAYKRASMPADWQNSSAQLNNFAWWCFENKVNLAEAKLLAEKGVAVAEPGIEKANVLDTLAEICNETGQCGDAVALIRQAVAEAPDAEYFKKQLTRFETALAASN